MVSVAAPLETAIPDFSGEETQRQVIVHTVQSIMDLEYGRRVYDEIMNNSAYDNQNDELDDAFRSGDPKALLELMGAGRPGGAPMPPSFPSPKEVRIEARDLSKLVLDQWQMLNGIITRHENTIRKRWTKKTKEQRRKILLSAWPNMSTSHRPDLADFFKSGPRSQSKDPDLAPYKWPSINLEDLSTSKLLLLCLNSRGRYTPDAFARADRDACHFGMTSGKFMPAFLNEYVMLFADRHTKDTYGELIAWEDHPDAFEWMISKYGFLPGEGLLLLEIQHRLYAFFVKCCKGILHELPEEALMDMSLPIQPEPPSLAGNETGLASLATSAAEAPYRVPAHLDLRRLASLVEAKLGAAEDHIWALREDPAYYTDTIREWKEHRQECLPDTRGRVHPVFSVFRQEDVFWGRVIGNAVSSAFAMVEMWGSIYDQIINLQHLAEKYAKDIQPSKNLPEEYAMAFYRLDHHLQQFAKGPIGTLKMGFVASPPMRPVFVREPPPDTMSTKIEVMKRIGLSKDESRDKLVWLIMTIFDEQQKHLAGLSTLMDEIERMMENDPRSKTLISSWVADQIADLSVFSQCLHQIELYQPWAATFETRMVEQEDELTKDYLSTQKNLQGYFNAPFGVAITKLGTPLDSRFDYPVNRRKTRENREAMIRAEKNLDQFWHAVDRVLSSRKAFSPRMAKLFSQSALERTPEWKEPSKPASPTTIQSDDTSTLVKPFSELQSGSTEHEDSTLTMPKVKVKTRGALRDSSSSSGTPPEVSPAQTQEDIHPTFTVSARAYKAFQTLFFTPSTSSQPGEIAWTDFLHALTSTGFMAEKLYGSVWQFTPTKLDVERSIHFHQPHPSGKIAFKTARRWGRRLERTYGWSGSMFTLA